MQDLVEALISDSSEPPSPFWDGFGSGQDLREGSELMQLGQQLQRAQEADDSQGMPSGSEEEWGLRMQSDWLIEVESPEYGSPINQMAVMRRPGEMRIATVIAVEL